MGRHPEPALPPAPTASPAQPSAPGQWLAFKEKQGKRGGRCHRSACLLTAPLGAAPHKSKKSIMAIVFFKSRLSLSKAPSSAVSSLLRVGNLSWRCFMRMAGRPAWGSLTSFSAFLATFFLYRHPAISFTLQPPHLKKPFPELRSASTTTALASSLAPAPHCHFEIGLGGKPPVSSTSLLDSLPRTLGAGLTDGEQLKSSGLAESEGVALMSQEMVRTISPVSWTLSSQDRSTIRRLSP